MTISSTSPAAGGAVTAGDIATALGYTPASTTALSGKLDTSHAGSGGTAHGNAVAAGAAGFMTGADKTKLDAITGTNTGNQTSIVGITGTLAEFNAALTGADFATGGGTATGSNTGDQTTITGNAGSATVLQTARSIDGVAFNGSADITVLAPATVAATGKTTPVDADVMPIADSAASNVLKKLSWANLKATLKTYFDTLYQVAGSYLTSGGALGTPSSGTLTNCTSLPTAGVTGLDTALAGKSPTSHGHAIADTTGLQTALDGKAAASHAHPLADVTGLASGVATFLAAPSSANMLAMVTDETGTGSNVFGTAPTITNARMGGYMLETQPTHTSKAAAATLTIAELLTRIIQYTGAAANLTLPTGTLIDAGVVPAMAVDQSFDFTIVNTSAAIATVVAGVGITLVGSGAVAAATSINFRARKTAANTYTVYRVG